MDKIKKYYELNKIQPKNKIPNIPFYKPSIKKILFNLNEINLHYYDEFRVYKNTKNQILS